MFQQLTPGRVQAELAEQHAGGQPIVLTGRFSKERAFLSAVRDGLEAADFLASLGIDIRGVIPPEPELVAQLKASKPVKSVQSNGRSFLNWFLEIDLRETHGVIFIISCGSGRKLDDDDSQPFVAYLAAVIRKSSACVLLATRIDRITRRAWALGPVMLALTRTVGFVGDARYGIRSVTGPESVLVYFSAQSAEDDAAKMPEQLGRGMLRSTGRSLSTGRMLIGFGTPVPPGLFTYRSKENGMIGPRVLTFDTPACFPAEEDVAAGRPQVLASDGSTADQVALVRWMLRTLGTPGATFRSVAEEADRRGYSTDHARRMGGVAAIRALDVRNKSPKSYLDTFLKHLDFYETGRLTLHSGIEGVDDLVVEDCFPPDGQGWATTQDFQRIRRWLREVRPANKRSLSFAGVSATIDGVENLLMTRSFALPNGGRRYVLSPCLAAPYRENFKITSPCLGLELPPDLLNQALVDALINAGDTALKLVPTPSTPEPDPAINAELQRADEELKQLRLRRDHLRSQLAERGAEGQPLLSGSLLKEVNDAYNKLVDADIPNAEIALVALRARTASVVEELRAKCGAVALDSLLHLLVALRDPHDLSFRHVIQTSVRDLTIDVLDLRTGRAGGATFDVNFNFLIEEGDNTLSVPVHTRHVRGTLADDANTGQQVLDQLKAGGATIGQLGLENPAAASQMVAQRLGRNGKKLMIGRIEDPRLAHLVAHLLDGADIVELATSTGEDPAFLERISYVHRSSSRSYWISKIGTLIIEVYRQSWLSGSTTKCSMVPAHASTWERVGRAMFDHKQKGQWFYDRPTQAWVLTPCKSCGSKRRSPALIPEPVGLVCLDCRLDQAGFSWPDDPYGAYIV